MFFEKLVEEFKKLDEVEALALGGSRATDNYDEKSDYDLYVYVNKSYVLYRRILKNPAKAQQNSSYSSFTKLDFCNTLLG